MKIAVIGASGRTGKIFVVTALAAGHEVVAGVHKNNTLPFNEKLTIITCDAMVESEVERLIIGAEAVVSLIGHVKGTPPNIQTDSTKNLVKAMIAQNITRIVSMTGTGVRFPGDKINLADRFLNFILRIIDPARLKDGIQHAEVLKSSGLNWTILRVLKLQDTSAGRSGLTDNGPTTLYVSRQDVAKAIINILEQNSFVKQAPMISPI